MRNSLVIATGSLALTFILVSSLPAFTLLDPARRVFDPPLVITVDERGWSIIEDFDGGVSAAIVSAEEWNTKLRTLVIAKAGAVPRALRTGDGQSTIRFDDPQKVCSKRFGCTAAAFVTYDKTQSGVCDGLELVPITEVDIIFNSEYRFVNSRYDDRECVGASLDAVVTHEVGHGLGLGHSEDGFAAMMPFTRACEPYPPRHDDWEGIKLLYGCDLVRE